MAMLNLVVHGGAMPQTFERGHFYDQDGLRSQHNHDFQLEPGFQAAYARGVEASGREYNWHWRVHIGLWAASVASKLKGDFVECGVGKGFLASAIMRSMAWSQTGRTFYLLDTFSGLDERYVAPEELAAGAMAHSREQIESGMYATNLDAVVQNFSEWRNVKVIAGPVPETLDQIKARKVAFLHIDMNCSPPEIAAIERMWPRLSPGAPVLLDDYAFCGYESQKGPMDAFAASKGVSIASLPTGQGLLLKPAKRGLF